VVTEKGPIKHRKIEIPIFMGDGSSKLNAILKSTRWRKKIIECNLSLHGGMGLKLVSMDGNSYSRSQLAKVYQRASWMILVVTDRR